MRAARCSIRRSISSTTIVSPSWPVSPGSNCSGSRQYEQTNYALLGDRRHRSADRPAVTSGELAIRAALTATQAREYANSFMRVLAAIVRSPERAIDLCSAMSCRLATSRNSSLSRRRPRRTQMRWSTDTATWTYAELDRSAERIAAGLLTAGMPPGARVGVMLDRSPELIATVLGVLKAGAAVVPLDVELPAARGSTR